MVVLLDSCVLLVQRVHGGSHDKILRWGLSQRRAILLVDSLLSCVGHAMSSSSHSHHQYTNNCIIAISCLSTISLSLRVIVIAESTYLLTLLRSGLPHARESRGRSYFPPNNIYLSKSLSLLTAQEPSLNRNHKRMM